MGQSRMCYRSLQTIAYLLGTFYILVKIQTHYFIHEKKNPRKQARNQKKTKQHLHKLLFFILLIIFHYMLFNLFYVMLSTTLSKRDIKLWLEHK